MGACQIIVIVLHLLIIPLNKIVFIFLMPCFSCFFPNVNVLLLLWVIILTSTLEIWYFYSLFVCCIIMCYRYEIKNLLLFYYYYYYFYYYYYYYYYYYCDTSDTFVTNINVHVCIILLYYSPSCHYYGFKRTLDTVLYFSSYNVRLWAQFQLGG